MPSANRRSGTARAIWKGRVRLGESTVPVKLYAAAQDRSVRFHLLHDQDLARVRQRLVDPRTGEEVEARDRRKGVEFERGRFVLLDDDELAALQPKASRDIRVGQFLPRGSIDHRFYERPYFLGPDGDSGTYFALAEAVSRAKVEGVAHWVMRKRDYAGALAAHDGHLMLFSLRHAGEVVAAATVEAAAGRAADAKELKLAEQLVGALAGPFEPEALRDEYRERVLALIEAKRQGQELEFAGEAVPKPSKRPLRAQLEASLAAAGAGGK